MPPVKIGDKMLTKKGDDPTSPLMNAQPVIIANSDGGLCMKRAHTHTHTNSVGMRVSFAGVSL